MTGGAVSAWAGRSLSTRRFANWYRSAGRGVGFWSSAGASPARSSASSPTRISKRSSVERYAVLTVRPSCPEAYPSGLAGHHPA